MNAPEISALIQRQREGLEPIINGIALETALVEPLAARALEVYGSRETKDIWVVARAGDMAVAYEPQTETFLIIALDPKVGWYIMGSHGTLRLALEAM